MHAPNQGATNHAARATSHLYIAATGHRLNTPCPQLALHCVPAACFTNAYLCQPRLPSIQTVEKNVDFALGRLFLEFNTKQTAAAGLLPAESAYAFHLKVTSASVGVKPMVAVGRRPFWRTLAANI